MNCGVELQRKKLEKCRCFLFSWFMPFHFDFLVSLPRVTSWWRTTKVTMVPQVPTARLRDSFDFGPPTATLSGFSTGMSMRFHGVLIQHSAPLIRTRFGHAIHIQPYSCIDFERRPVGSLTPFTIDMFTPYYFYTARVFLVEKGLLWLDKFHGTVGCLPWTIRRGPHPELWAGWWLD